MIETIIYFFIGLSLSIDAFSLSLSIGTLNLNKKQVAKLPIFIGIFHFFMPFIGILIGKSIATKLIIKVNFIIFIIFAILSLSLILTKENEKQIPKLNMIKCIILSLIVSLDSLTVGFAIGLSNVSIFKLSSIISIVSTISTFLGLILGKKVKEMYNNKSKYIGAIILIVIAFKYLIYG